MQYPLPIAKLIESYMKLPGVGQKTATRLAFFTLNMETEDIQDFSKSLVEVKTELHYCSICGNITQEDPCEICRDERVDRSTILVVEQPKDILSFENMGEYFGLYHVLNGVLSPMDGVSVDDLNIKSLIKRLQDHSVKEVILALNSSSEGEATAMYLSKLIKPSGIKVSRLASGLAVGSDIEYADDLTLKRAMTGRQEV